MTHENTLAVHQFITFSYQHENQQAFTSKKAKRGGAKLIFDLIYYHHKIISCEGKNDDINKQTYDTIVYCLNILTNVMEVMTSSSSTASTLLSFKKDILQLEFLSSDEENLKNNNEKSSQPAILWLTSWLVSLTATYQNAIIKGSFGKTNDSSKLTVSEEDRDLTNREKESLVLAGNGFIFLVWFLKESHSKEKTSSCSTLDESVQIELAKIKQNIFTLMPFSEGKLFIRNVLKAFSNFYHYSIGELSFAVVAPVRKLIMDLETI